MEITNKQILKKSSKSEILNYNINQITGIIMRMAKGGISGLKVYEFVKKKLEKADNIIGIGSV